MVTNHLEAMRWSSKYRNLSFGASQDPSTDPTAWKLHLARQEMEVWEPRICQGFELRGTTWAQKRNPIPWASTITQKTGWLVDPISMIKNP